MQGGGYLRHSLLKGSVLQDFLKYLLLILAVQPEEVKDKLYLDLVVLFFRVYYILLTSSQMKIKTLFISFFRNQIELRMNLCRASSEGLWFPYPYLKTAVLVVVFLFVS